MSNQHDTDDWMSRRTLVKLGGSLLQLPDLAARLNAVLSQVSLPVLLVGGGRTADLVRDWDRTFGLTDEASHDLAIRAMSLNALMIVNLDDRLQSAATMAEADDIACRGMIPVLDVVSVIASIEDQVAEIEYLERSWHVTSDSIGAWIASHSGIPRVLLLKSCDAPPTGDSWTENLQTLHDAEVVDPQFIGHAQLLSEIRWCNLATKPNRILSVCSQSTEPAAKRRRSGSSATSAHSGHHNQCRPKS